MSGIFKSTGKQTNKGENLLDISDLLNLRIMSMDIYSIPLSNGILLGIIRGIGKIFQPFIHPALSPTFCHIAVKLNLENLKDIIIIEFGQYLTKESEKYFDDSNDLFNIIDYREEHNKAQYYYINDDGVRITRIENNKNKNIINNQQFIALQIASATATAVPYFSAICNPILYRNFFLQVINQFNVVKCNVNNKITLNELKNEFLGENWKTRKYNLLNHNCQDFAADVIKILKATRIFEKDKIRMNEKNALPNCLINALTKNEETSTINILGRIPIFGLFFDLFIAKNIVK